MQFQLVSTFKPAGDQPKAIASLAKHLKAGAEHQVLLGVTGSGKTYTMSHVIERIGKPTLVVLPNKILAAQLYQEFKEFFPRNGVHYFVSYYDYYQPEAYIPHTDTYIEKDAKINDVLDRLRHEAVQDLSRRKDCIVVASVSCIYNIGSPEEYQQISLSVQKGQRMGRKEFLSSLAMLQYQRNDIEFQPGTFRVRGDIVELFSVTGKEQARVEFENGNIADIAVSLDHLVPRYQNRDSYTIYPAKFWVTPEAKLKVAMNNIRLELEEQTRALKAQNKLLEAQRLEQRTNYDLEMIREAGYCHGIENYSRHLEFRKPGDPPYTLLDYFGDEYLVFIDESHLTIPQVRAMSAQDRVRKESLVNYGFRLPSAIDNRPLTLKEFYAKAKQFVYVSATPDDFELELAQKNAKLHKASSFVVEQLVRPTGLLEPKIEVRPTNNQIADLVAEAETLARQKKRVLVLALTKRLAEDIASHLADKNINTQWLHSEIKTLERPAILEGLRKGEYDALVGVNLLREGLDLPEVALVAILDADKEGFLRNDTTLIQMMGRAARHTEGMVILYADTMTESIKSAMKEIERRRTIQEAYNNTRGITPTAITKGIRPWLLQKKKSMVREEFSHIRDIALLEQEMKTAAESLDFERAAELRDFIATLSPKTKRL